MVTYTLISIVELGSSAVEKWVEVLNHINVLCKIQLFERHILYVKFKGLLLSPSSSFLVTDFLSSLVLLPLSQW
jgi:hypothetical protein